MFKLAVGSCMGFLLGYVIGYGSGHYNALTSSDLGEVIEVEAKVRPTS